MEKEFVTYEMAFKLKQLGFNEPCFGWFTDFEHFYLNNIKNGKMFKDNNGCLAPTWQSAFRWFREKYDLFTHIEKGENPKNFYPIIDNISHKYNPKLWFDTYEEAELECLKKLIEIVENIK
jgi:hypothetical protein